MSRGVSLHIGLNFVDPNAYGGWNGQLAGCINDANDMQAIAEANGFTPSQLIDNEATSGAVIEAIGRCARDLTSGDILLLTYSGHGGQVDDVEQDEADNQDETWVLWDRQLVDDELANLWSQFCAGVRIAVFSDSCHSGTVLRMMRGDFPAPGKKAIVAPREAKVAAANRAFSQVREAALAATRSVPTAAMNGYRAPEPATEVRMMPPQFSAADAAARKSLYDAVQWAAGSQQTRSISASVLLISGCQDNQVSLDGAANGLFTQRLKEAWANGAFNGDYRAFRQEIGRRSPASQSPNFYTAGCAWPAFEEQRPFEVMAPAGVAPGVPVVTPTPTPTPTGGGPGTATARPTLRRGATGEHVEYLQQLLVRLGYPLDVDGDFGNATHDAVVDFQECHNLTADGIVGQMTWNAVAESAPAASEPTGGGSQPTPSPTGGTAPTPPTPTPSGGSGSGRPVLRRPDRGDAVKDLQRLLLNQGYNVTVDGMFGPMTESNVRDFQRSVGLSPTGIVDAATWQSLESRGAAAAAPGSGTEYRQSQLAHA